MKDEKTNSEHSGEIFAYWNERDMALDHDHCFLCGVRLTKANRTDEHVFPQWLLRDFRLHNLTLNLLDGSERRYSSLKIPCCEECNGFWLAQIENKVAASIRSGYEAVRELDSLTLCLWMAKIYYGLLFMELGIPLDPRQPEGETIMNAELLGYLRDLHHVLQAARRRVVFEEIPSSIFIFRAQVPTDEQERFDYRDTLYVPFFAIRAGETVILASLLDWGAMQHHIDIPKFDVAAQLELHPLQFAELAAYGIYVAANFDRTPKYIIMNDGERDVMHVLPIQGMSRKPLFKPYVAEDYAQVLAGIVGVPLERVLHEQGVWTWLVDEAGQPNAIPIEESPASASRRPDSAA